MKTKKELESRVKELEEGISYALDSIKIIEHKKFELPTISSQLANAKWMLAKVLNNTETA